MPWRLTPRSPAFAEPLHALASTCAAAAHALRDVVGLPVDEREEPLRRLQDLEREGTDLRRRLLALVDDTFVTPIDRRDLVGVVAALQRCLERTELAGDLVARAALPQGADALVGHVDVLVLLGDRVATDATLLLRPQDSGGLTAEIHRLEDVADRRYREVVVELLTGGEPDALALTVVLDRLGGAVEGYGRLASVLEAAARTGF